MVLVRRGEKTRALVGCKGGAQKGMLKGGGLAVIHTVHTGVRGEGSSSGH